MTYRARPVAKRRKSAGWDSDERRTALINGGFILAIVAAILILVGYGAWSWYSDHLGTAATVDDVTLTRDQLRTQIAIDTFRTKYAEHRIQDELTAGHISQQDAAQQMSYLDQQLGSIGGIALEDLIDTTLQARLATTAGLSVSDAEVDAQLTKDATLPEQRHVWLIEVAPAVDPTTGQVGDAQKAAAKQKAQDALAQLKAGRAWDDIAKTVSTATSAPQAGDLGWLLKDSGYDADFMTAVFAAQVNTPTDVIVGSDGTARIGRVTEVASTSVDQAYSTKVQDAGVSLADYRTAVKAEVVTTKLRDKVVVDLSKPGPQRHVLQIYLPDSQATASSVKVREILFAPNNDPAGAKNLNLDDPAWQAAKDAAFAAYHDLQLDPTKFDLYARTRSDDSGTKDNGGKMPYADRTTALDPTFAEAIFASGLRQFEILPPVKSTFGWHVIQFMHSFGAGDETWLADLKTRAEAGIDFGQLARDNGEGPEAKNGGDIGWVVKGQLSPQKEDPIFSTAVGSVSDPVTIQGDGVYLFKVLAEETRTPSADQISTFKSSGFSTWYQQQKNAATITRDAASTPLGQ
ncbi:MAG TPA: peptidylprolyl isomerase [Candidatus Limnocylindrales bacterium]|nr:peptidylprolyl isomerase [Candidatus Limnocylindrales bacterium]